MTKIKLLQNQVVKTLKIIIKYFKENTKKSVFILVSLLIVILMLNHLLSLKLKASTDNIPLKGLSEVKETLDYNNGEQLVFENESKAMYINTKTTNIRIVDKSTNKEWNTLANSISGGTPEKALSPFIVNYYQGLESINLDAYTYSIINEDGTLDDDKGFEINKIDTGVQIVYYIEDLNFLKYLFEYIPRQMKVESYENKILGKLNNLKTNETITTDEYERYLSVFESVYSFDDKETPPRYSYTYSGFPPVNRARKLLELFQIVEYTRDDLIEDNDAFGILTPYTEIPRMKFVMELTLDGDDFLVRIPTYEMTATVEDATIASVRLFPYFGDVNGNQFNEGSIFVPDGSGALISLNSYSQTYPSYEKSIYNNKVYKDYYYRKPFNEEINMPIYGMVYGDETSINQGFLAIIENGAEVTSLYAKSANITSSSQSVNQIYPRFDTYLKSEVNLYGEYSNNDTAKYLFKGDFIDFDYEIRFLLLSSENQSYYTLAKRYQEYLIDKYSLTKDYNQDSPQVFLDVIGSVNIDKRFLGIPYESTYSMTTYNELQEMLKTLENINYVVNYRGAFNGGYNQGLPTHIDFLKENGKIDDYHQLIQYIESENQEFYFDVLFGTPYVEGEYGFSKRNNSSIGFNNNPITMYQYDLASNNFDYDSTPYYLLDARYLENVVDLFVKDYEFTPNIAVRDLGHVFFGDNGANGMNPILANYYVENSITKLNENYNLILNDPQIEFALQAKYVGNISREKSQYGIFDEIVPFKEIVLNGLTTLYSKDINMYNDHELDYYLLQALELGINPKFTVTYENPNILMNTEFNYLYSTQFTQWKEDIVDLYHEYEEAYNLIGSKEIVGHEILLDNVYKTTYANGKAVIYNYNKYDVNINEQVIGSLSYLIIEGGW